MPLVSHRGEMAGGAVWDKGMYMGLFYKAVHHMKKIVSLGYLEGLE
jgi:hypothetical protein